MKTKRMRGRSKGGRFFFVNETQVATVAILGSVNGWGPQVWRKVVEICD